MATPSTPLQAEDIEHLKLMLTGAGILVSLMVGLICWLIKRDLGKMDGQLKTATEAITKLFDALAVHEKQAISKFGKIEKAITEINGRIDTAEKLCDERNKRLPHTHSRATDPKPQDGEDNG